MDVMEKLSRIGLIPVIKVQNAQDAVPLCRALEKGGLPAAEITFRSDAAEEAIRLVHQELPEVVLGAGTVLTCEQADRAWNAGAGYIVSPGLNPNVVKHCLKKGYPVLPGCATPGEIEMALELGLDTVKFFPSEAIGGVKAIKAMSAPYGKVKFVPTGGINEKNLPDYTACAAIIACGGSWMVPQDAIEKKDWGRIESLTRTAVSTLLGLHLAHIGVNSEDEQTCLKEAKKLSLLMGLPMNRDNPKSVFVGNDVEMMKNCVHGVHGHIAVGTPDVERARWHLEQMGFEFDESSITYTPDGHAKLLYFKDEIAGFGIHLLRN